MPNLEFEHQFHASFGGPGPDERKFPLIASTLEDAKEQAEDAAARFGIPTSQLRYFYRLHILASTNWAEVGEHTNYDETVKELLSTFEQPTVTTWPRPKMS